MSRVELIIFDCDGVLVETESVAAEILSTYLTDQGVALSAADCEERFNGMDLSVVQEQVEAMGGVIAHDFVTTVRARIFDALSKGVEPVPGVRELLRSVTLPFCVASGGMPAKIRQSLNLANLLDQFEPNIFSAFDVGHHKPEPHLFLHAAKSMDVDAAKTIVVEDSRVGVQAALAAGMQVVGYVGDRLDKGRELRDVGAHHIIEDMRHMANFL
jgi:HAD superfamily hydrolase (TIGR01509 family)